MEFKNEEALQDFLISFLVNVKGIQCVKEYRLPSGERLDILALPYAIECKPKLDRKTLDSAVGQLGRYMPHLTGCRPVVAGLSADSGRTAAASHRSSGIQVWFIDEIQEICDYHNELYGYEPEMETDPETQDEDAYYSSRSYTGSSYDDSGCIGAVIAGVVGMIAFVAIAVGEYNNPIRELHRAAIHWDVDTANKAIARLKTSSEECEVLLGNTFEWEIQRVIQQGTTGNDFYILTFNRLNVIQNWLMQEYPQCTYPPLEHPNQINE